MKPLSIRKALARQKVTPNRRRPALTVVTEERLHQVETERHRRVRRQAALLVTTVCAVVCALGWLVHLLGGR